MNNVIYVNFRVRPAYGRRPTVIALPPAVGCIDTAIIAAAPTVERDRTDDEIFPVTYSCETSDVTLLLPVRTRVTMISRGDSGKPLRTCPGDASPYVFRV